MGATGACLARIEDARDFLELRGEDFSRLRGPTRSEEVVRALCKIDLSALRATECSKDVPPAFEAFPEFEVPDSDSDSD